MVVNIDFNSVTEAIDIVVTSIASQRFYIEVTDPLGSVVLTPAIETGNTTETLDIPSLAGVALEGQYRLRLIEISGVSDAEEFDITVDYCPIKAATGKFTFDCTSKIGSYTDTTVYPTDAGISRSLIITPPKLSGSTPALITATTATKTFAITHGNVNYFAQFESTYETFISDETNVFVTLSGALYLNTSAKVECTGSLCNLKSCINSIFSNIATKIKKQGGWIHLSKKDQDTFALLSTHITLHNMYVKCNDTDAALIEYNAIKEIVDCDCDCGCDDEGDAPYELEGDGITVTSGITDIESGNDYITVSIVDGVATLTFDDTDLPSTSITIGTDTPDEIEIVGGATATPKVNWVGTIPATHPALSVTSDPAFKIITAFNSTTQVLAITLGYNVTVVSSSGAKDYMTVASSGLGSASPQFNVILDDTELEVISSGSATNGINLGGGTYRTIGQVTQYSRNIGFDPTASTPPPSTTFAAALPLDICPAITVIAPIMYQGSTVKGVAGVVQISATGTVIVSFDENFYSGWTGLPGGSMTFSFTGTWLSPYTV